MARKPLIGAVLQRTQSLAQTVGMTDIHRFLRLGYHAILPVRDIHRFVETILLRAKCLAGSRRHRLRIWCG